MAGQDQIFRIFVSSTFSDMKSERNALQAFVFPRLRELCESKGARFQPIDLRWGVSTEASLDQQAMNICLSEVARCQNISPRPNFIVLLGDRYGWMPPPADIPETEYKQIFAALSSEDQTLLEQWYTLDLNAIPHEFHLNPRERDGPYETYEAWQPIESALHRILSDVVDHLPFSEDRKLIYKASATHQEIKEGAFNQMDAPEHVFCFFRQIKNLPRKFNIATFQELLVNRLKLRFSQGLSESCQVFVNKIMLNPTETSPADIRDQVTQALTKTAKATPEEEEITFIQKVLSDFTARDFINLNEETLSVDQDALGQLTQLKENLRSEFRDNLFTADHVAWLGDKLPSGKDSYQLFDKDHIGTLPGTLKECLPLLNDGYEPQNLCEAVFHSLGSVILAEIQHPHPAVQEEGRIIHIKQAETLDSEGLAHHAFAEERLTYFIGREKILAAISAYLQRDDHQTFVITGGGGTGKSALMAKVLERAQDITPEAHLVYRFIGATPGSSDGRSLLYSICQEISRCFDASEGDIPLDYRDLVPELNKRMHLATAETPLIILIDSLDQLSENYGARDLTWLPTELPEFVSLIVSTRIEKDIIEHLQSKQVTVQNLEGLNRDEGEKLLKYWLGDVDRTLQKDQRREVVEKFIESKGNPLYLKLAFEEARRWTSYERPREVLAAGVGGIIKKNMLDRLTDEGNHGEQIVSHALAYLAASRYGLAEDEIVDLLSRDLQVYEWFFRQTYHLPSDLVRMAVAYLRDNPERLKNFTHSAEHDAEGLAAAWLKQDRHPPEDVMEFLRSVLNRSDGPRLPIVMWSRLSFDLEPYLTERLVDGSALLYFYHRELKDVSESEFLTEQVSPLYHEKIANYFQDKADPIRDRSWRGGYKHGLSELPYHLISAGLRDEVFTLLTDFKFLEHKAEEVGITRSTNKDGLEVITSEGVQDLQKDYEIALNTFYGGSGDEIDEAPLIRTAEEIGGKLQVYCPVCNKKSHILRDILGQVITCPQEKCDAKLKLNTFTILMD